MRITGGIHRSRSLVAPRGHATRPTADRVREALFAILGADEPIDGARVLDLYAGTGALALEALSRGAAEAVVVERGREALEAIRANVAALRVEAQTRIMGMNVERAVEKTLRGGTTFDLVFADPPYADVLSAAHALASLSAAQLLTVGARVVLEHGSGDSPPPIAGLAFVQTRRYGDSSLTFYVHAPPSDAAA